MRYREWELDEHDHLSRDGKEGYFQLSPVLARLVRELMRARGAFVSFGCLERLVYADNRRRTPSALRAAVTHARRVTNLLRLDIAAGYGEGYRVIPL